MAYKRELIINNGSLTSYKKLLKVSDVCQLLDKSKYPATQTINGVTFTNNGDGTITVNSLNITANAHLQLLPSYIDAKKGHKYCALSGTNRDGGCFYVDVLNENGAWVTEIVDNLYTAPADNRSLRPTIIAEKNKPFGDKTYKPQLFDLTEMYGAGNEPATVAEFKAKFPNEMYDYSPRCWVRSYKTGLIAKTKNLFNWSGKLKQYADTANCTIVETLINGAILQGNIGSKPGNASYDNGWFRPGAEDGYGTAVTLSANDVVTISADYEILERNYASPTTIGVYLYGTEPIADQWSQIETGVLYRIKATYTIAKDGQYYPVFTLNSSKVKITNIQIEKGSTATDYVPYGYL